MIQDSDFSPDSETDALLHIIASTKDSGEISKALEKAAFLPEQARYYIADKLDRDLSRIIENTFDLNEDMMEALESALRNDLQPSSDPDTDLFDFDYLQDLFQGIGQWIAFIVANKGDEAGLCAKTFAEEIARLPVRERVSPRQELKTMLTVLTMIDDWDVFEAERQARRQEKALVEKKFQKRMEKLKTPHSGGIVLKKA